MRRPTRRHYGEGCQRPGMPRYLAERSTGRLRRGSGDSMRAQGDGCNTGSPVGGAHAPTGNPRGPAWAGRVAERLVVPGKPGNAGGGKGPWFGKDAGKEAGTMGTGASLSAPISVRKLRMASHAEAKRALGRRVAAAGMHGRGRHGGRAGGWVGSWRRSPGRRALAGRQPHDCGRNAGRRQAQLRVGESMISSESPVREIRTLGSMSGERKRGQGGD